MKTTPHEFVGLTWNEGGYFELNNDDTGGVPVRLFLTESLLADIDDAVYKQIVDATKFPGTKLVVITPDVHLGYGVPVGCVILTDAHEGAVAMGPVGYDIGCGISRPARRFRSRRRRLRSAAPSISPSWNAWKWEPADGAARSKRSRKTGSRRWYAAGHRRTADSSARRSSAATANATGYPSTTTGKFRGADGENPSAVSSRSGASAGGTTSSSCSAACKPRRSSCRSIPGAAASGTGSRPIISTSPEPSGRPRSSMWIWGILRPTHPTTAAI